MDVGFFEFGADQVSNLETPEISRGERLWGHPGLRPLSGLEIAASPIGAYRWEHTDRALREQLALEAEGYSTTVSPGHAALRFINPTTGGDVMPTIRCQFHCLRAGQKHCLAAMLDLRYFRFLTEQVPSTSWSKT